MKSFAQLLQETSAVQLDFLLTDIAAANTFLDVANTTRDAETRTRNVQNGKEAYAVVHRMSGRVHINAEQTVDLENKLRLLKERLETMDGGQSSPGA